MSELTEYEKERLARIAENKKLLQQLQLDTASRASRDGTPEIKPKPVKRKAPSDAKVARSIAQQPVSTIRTRSRTERTASLASRDPEAARRKQEKEEEEEQQRLLEVKKAKHEDREIEVWNPSGRFIMEEAALPLRQLLHSIAGSGTWKRSLHSSIKIRDSTNGYASDSTTSSPTAPVPASRRAASSRATNSRRTSAVKKEESDAEDDMFTSERIGMTSLRKTFDNMSMKAIKKITPDRVYSLAVHPTTDKDLVFVGDRKGWMGIWNASADAAEEEAKPEEIEEQSYDAHAFAQRVYNDHGTIACMRFDPLQAHTIYASSYDCTVRSLNFEVGVWTEIIDVDLQAARHVGEGEALISAFEVTHDGNSIWLSDNKGGVMHADLREDKKKHRRWKVAENKVGCISLNPANENMFATAHLNRDMRIWDARKLTKLDSKTSDYYTSYDKACVASYEHGKAVTSAYFDPSGRHLLSTSYDDKLRVWDIKPKELETKAFGDFKPKHSVYHDNNTGAYTSVFKGTWSSNPLVEPYFTIGNMKRTLDIYGKDCKLITSLSEGLTTIPAVTCGHPSQPALFGGAAGGKIYYWRADQWE